MKHYLLLIILIFGCNIKPKKYKITYSDGRSSITIFVNHYSIQPNGCVLINDTDVGNTLGHNESPHLICGDYNITEIK